MSCLFHVLEELRLGSPWVTKHKDVDVTPDSVFVVDVLRDTAKQRQSNSGLDVLVSVDRRSDGFDDPLTNTVVPSQSPNLPFVLFREPEGGELVFFLVDVVGLDDR